MLHAGLDEAGRGPVIGPMFVALCGVPDVSVLDGIGVQDSKAYGSGVRARQRRQELARRIAQVATVRVAQVMPVVIDAWVSSGPGLTVLEQESARDLIGSVPHSLNLICDGRTVFGPFEEEFGALVENRADERWPVVSAASIVAKHLRDQWMERYFDLMERRLGFRPAGGGYPNQATVRFIEKYIDTFGTLPPSVRRSWKFLNQFSAAIQIPLFNDR